MLGVFCCAPGPDVFWYRDLNQNLGACPGQDCRQRREGQDQLAAYLPAGHGSGSCSPSLCGGRRHVQHVRIRWLSYGFQCRNALCSHIQRWLWEVVFLFITSWCKSDVESVLLCPAARFYFEKVIFMWGVVFCILSFFLAQRWNSCNGRGFFLFSNIMMQLWCWEDYFLSHIMMQLWWRDLFFAVPLGQFASDKVICDGCSFSVFSFPHQDATLMLRGFLSPPHHDTTLVRWVSCCASGLDVFWYIDAKSWCNSDFGGVLVCPCARCVQLELNVCRVLWSVFFVSHIKKNLLCQEGFLFIFSHHDATMVLGFFCFDPGPVMFWCIYFFEIFFTVYLVSHIEIQRLWLEAFFLSLRYNFQVLDT